MYQVRILNIDELTTLRDKWNSLVMSMHHPSIFCTWEWMKTWWIHFGQSYSPLILLIYNKNELVGIMPLAKRTMISEDGLLPTRTLVLWSSIELHADHLDIISSQKDAFACVDAALHYLQNDYRSWDLLFLSHINNDSFIVSAINDNYRQRASIQIASTAPFIAIDRDHNGNFENFMRSLGRNRRHDVIRRTKKLREEHGVEYVFSDPENNPQVIDLLFSLHASRAESKGIKTTFRGDRLLRFHKEIANVFYRNDWLRLGFLKKGDNYIASIYCFVFNKKWFAYQSGLDPEWESQGAGSVIICEAIREAFDESAMEFDFLRGGEAYKNTWTKTSRELFNVRLYNDTLYGNISKFSHKTRSYVKRVINNYGYSKP